MSAKTAEYKAVARKDMTYRQWIWKEMKRNWVAYVMIAPYMIVFTLFTIVPVFLSVLISFTDFNMLQIPNFVWIENYINLFFADEQIPGAINLHLIVSVIIA